LAVDITGNVWVTHEFSSFLVELNSAGQLVSPAAGFTSVPSGFSPFGVAATTSGAVAVSGYGGTAVFSGSGALSSGPTGCGNTNGPLAVDHQGAVWLLQYYGGVCTTAGGTAHTASLSDLRYSDLALDGAGNAWVTFTNSIVPYSGVAEYSNSLVLLSPSIPLGNGVDVLPGYGTDTIAPPASIAVDGSGNVWFTSTSSTTSGNTTVQHPFLDEIVGIATPVVTPLVAGAQQNALGSRP
jgi:streptogramin lyase